MMMMIRWQLLGKYWIWLLLLVAPFVVYQFGQVECCLEEERLALIELEAYMISYSDVNYSSWLNHSEINCCKWSEVRCSVSTGHITSLNFYSAMMTNNEDARKKPWLFNVTLFSPFSQLISLDLTSNSINCFVDKHGSTNISTLKNLQALHLDGNNLKSCHISVSDLTSLKILSLVGAGLNESSFPLYQELPNLRKLQELYLDGNYFFGDIEGTWLCRLTNLQVLSLRFNNFKGGIPPCIKNLTSLQELDLSNNNLEGVFSMHSLANHSKLQSLWLSRNNKLQVQTEDALWRPTFQLQELLLSDCSLNEPYGTIPSFLLHQSNFSRIDLTGNNLVGTFPNWLLTNNSHLQYLSVENNFLTGNLQLPHHVKPLELEYLSIANNKIRGELPKSIGFVFPSLIVLYLEDNFFEGHIPSSISRLTSLIFLDMSHNNLTGNISSLFSNLSKLVLLRLRNNNLKGSVSDVLLSGLVELDLANNHLTGNIPQWINKFQNMRVLQISGNRLQGHIPLQLCELTHINILDISHNNLSGEVPSCFKNMSFGDTNDNPNIILDTVNVLTKNVNLNYTTKSNLVIMSLLDLSCNKLTGLVPSELGELQYIHSLNLSHNYLSGAIPDSFSNLKQIESLDLSFNNLSGRIPAQLVELNTLEIFNVSYNNLSGRVPVTGQFGTFDESSYRGNLGLFGFLESVMHNQTQGLTPSSLIGDGGDEDHDGTFAVNFFWCFGMSCATSFLATIAVLYINRQWRQACFDFIDWYLLWWLPMSWRSLY